VSRPQALTTTPRGFYLAALGFNFKFLPFVNAIGFFTTLTINVQDRKLLETERRGARQHTSKLTTML
jgi:hypothetical protein